MNNSVTVQILKCRNDLGGVALDFEFVQPLPPLEQLVKGLVLAQLQEDVDVLAVLEEVLEVAHIHVVDAPVDLDLAH